MKVLHFVKTHKIEVFFFFVVGSLVSIMLILAIFFWLPRKSDNVFEEMYYGKMQESGFWLGAWMGLAKDTEYCEEHVSGIYDGHGKIYYYQEKRIDFAWKKWEKTDTGETKYYIMVYSYNFDTEELSYGGNVSDHGAALVLETAVKEWLLETKNSSKYSTDDWGDYTDAGRTFPKEEWTKYHEYDGEWHPSSNQ